MEYRKDPLLLNLLYVRGQRDAVARDLEFQVWTEKGEEWIRDIVTYSSPNSGRAHIEKYLIDNRKFDTIKTLDLLYKLSCRAARLEREACGIELGELKTA